MSDTTRRRLPTYFISHGGGPWPWIMDQMPGDWQPLKRSLEDIPRQLDATPRAVLAVSGHWETAEFTVRAGEQIFFEAFSQMGPGSIFMILLLGVGPLYLTLKRMY